MTYEIKRFDLLTVFKVSFLIYLIIGFLVGILYGMILMKMMSAFAPLLENQLFEGFQGIGFMAALTLAFFTAIFLAVIWSIITVIAAGLYNVLSGWIGGFKVEMEMISGIMQQQMPPTSSAGPPAQGGSLGV